jgi:hypothetical protein
VPAGACLRWAAGGETRPRVWCPLCTHKAVPSQAGPHSVNSTSAEREAHSA